MSAGHDPAPAKSAYESCSGKAPIRAIWTAVRRWWFPPSAAKLPV